uniref:Ingression protein fic1 n=1 Tax=Talaromyces marneffei PM1 TaxID=1077442 RepID=A0A093UYY5_TALMA
MAQKLVKMPTAHGHTSGIFADMSVDGPQIGTLVVIFDRAKNLPNRKTIGKQNPYVAARLGKEAKKTETDMRGGQTPRWDQEIRYTVHESPDYLQLKVSVFNDDKRTDLIGETWVDLSSVIIPGGGQSDSWHELRFRNKYAGDIRLEMTYYDTRPEDEAVIERRTVVTEKPQSRSSNNTAPTGSSSLSGPRQPRPIKRRPLPDDPTGASPSRATPAASAAPPVPVVAAPPVAPAAPVQDYSAPIPSNTQPPRPSADYAPPASSHRQSDARPSSRHTEMPFPQASQFNQYDHNAPGGNTVVPVDQRDDQHSAQPRPYHESNDRYYGEPQRQMNHPVAESYGDAYDPNSYQARVSHEAVEQYSQYSNQPHPSHPDDTRYSAEPMPYIPDRYVSQAPQSHEYAMNTHDEPSYEENDPYRHNNALIQPDPRRQSPLRQLMAPEDDRYTYAAMQPTVEDENDEGLPPPPPIHRTTVNTNIPPSSGTAGYKPYSPQEYTPPHPEVRDSHRSSVVSPVEQDLAVSMSRPSQATSRSFYPEPPSPSVPASLAAGYSAANETVDNQQAYTPDRSYGRFQPSAPSRETANYVPNVPQPQTSAIQPLRTSPAPIMDRARSISPNPRPLSYRKSISPRPPSRDERDVSSVPFSPDSFDTYNPRRSPSATRESGSRYATPDRSVESSQSPKPNSDDGPIIADDGRIIDPSDHLPSESWAPEPEKKNKKPEVIVRFKHNPQHSSYAARSSTRDQHHSAPTTPNAVVRSVVRPRSTYVIQQPRQSYERHQRTPTTTTYTPPRPSTRDYDRQDTYAQPQQHRAPSPTTYSTPPRQRSISPNPQPRSSPLYSYSESGPPIPVKVPIAAPASSGYMGGMDALSQEIQSIDIGPGGGNFEGVD